jgi:hypothetical protein
MEDTSGFYKNAGDEGWFYAPHAVYNRDYELHREGSHEPIDGWYWHDQAPEEYLIWLYKQNHIMS